MDILADTPIWSFALRRRQGRSHLSTRHLQQLVEEFRIRMIGPIRQEILSGVVEIRQFEQLQKYLTAFPDEPLQTTHYETAAQMYNACRSKGIAGSHVDFLICSAAHHGRWAIYTTDKDFIRYAKLLGIQLFEP